MLGDGRPFGTASSMTGSSTTTAHSRPPNVGAPCEHDMRARRAGTDHRNRARRQQHQCGEGHRDHRSRTPRLQREPQRPAPSARSCSLADRGQPPLRVPTRVRPHLPREAARAQLGRGERGDLGGGAIGIDEWAEVTGAVPHHVLTVGESIRESAHPRRLQRVGTTARHHDRGGFHEG